MTRIVLVPLTHGPLHGFAGAACLCYPDRTTVMLEQPGIQRHSYRDFVSALLGDSVRTRVERHTTNLDYEHDPPCVNGVRWTKAAVCGCCPHSGSAGRFRLLGLDRDIHLGAVGDGVVHG